MSEVKNISVGDCVRIGTSNGCVTIHPYNMLGVVQHIYKDQADKVQAYGIQASGELIYYLPDQVERVNNVAIHDPKPVELVNRSIEMVILDRCLMESCM